MNQNKLQKGKDIRLVRQLRTYGSSWLTRTKVRAG